MSPVRLGVAAVMVAAAAWTGATVRGAAPQRAAATGQRGAIEHQPGPDSARVARLLATLDQSEPLLCALAADQIGNGGWNNASGAPGQFADTRADMSAVRDSLRGPVEQPATLQLLQGALGHANACVRRVAAKLLGRSRIATEQIAARLDDPSPLVREAAAFAIGEGHTRQARAALERVLASGGAAEAAMAAWALQEADDAAAVPALERALRHTDARVRASAAYALGELDAFRSVDALSAAINDPDVRVRYAAVAALGEIHDLEQAPPALRKASTSTDRHLARLATIVLAELHDPGTLDLLISLATMDDADVRRRIAEALGEIGSTKANPVLMQLLSDQDPDVRRAAAEALGELRENSARH